MAIKSYQIIDGYTEFLDLLDTPSTYSGQSGKLLGVTSNGLVFLNADAYSGNTLDQSYDEGGSGVGRTITIDSGPIQLNASNVEALSIDGYIGLSEISDPTNLTGKGLIYTADDSGDTELFYKDDSGNSVQITKDGTLNSDEINAHTVGGGEHTADTLANFNTKISDATLFDISLLDSYLALNGEDTMSGNLDIGENNIINVGNVDGYDLPATFQSIANDDAYQQDQLTDINSDLIIHINDIANPHSTDIGNLGSGTLSELNSIITDATLIDVSLLDSYLALDGSNSMSADLDIGGNNIINVVNVDGYDLPATFQSITNDDAYQQGELTDINSDLIIHINDIANPHSTDVGNLGSGTLTELNSVITDATLFDISLLDSYLALNGEDTMSGNLDLGSNNIINVGSVDGYDLPATFQSIENDDAYQQGELTNINSDLISHTDNTSNPHSTDVGNLGSGTLAELNLIITDATLFDRSELDGYSALDHDLTHISSGTDEIDGDKIDIDWNPTNYVPTTSPSEVSSADELTAHLAGIDGYLLILGNDVDLNSTDIATNTSSISTHTSNTSNPHQTTMDLTYDAGGSGLGRTIVADSGPVYINANGADALELDGYLTLGETSDPSQLGNAGIAYTKDIDGYSELHVMDNWGNIIQLTNRGFLYTLLPEYSVSQLPSASPAGQMVYVSDETGGAVMAFSDGTNWRRTTDRNIVS